MISLGRDKNSNKSRETGFFLTPIVSLLLTMQWSKGSEDGQLRIKNTDKPTADNLTGNHFISHSWSDEET